MNKKLSSADKIKKENRIIYENKIGSIVGYIKEIVDSEAVKISIEPWLVKWTQEMGQLSE